MSQIANLFGGGGSVTPGTTPIISGTDKRLLFDDNGVVGETVGLLWRKATGSLALSTAGTVSVPTLGLTGVWFTGGSATTTKPQFLIEPAGTTSTNWSTSGTGIGVNADSAFAGNLLDLQVASTRQFSVQENGQVLIYDDGGNVIATMGASNSVNFRLSNLSVFGWTAGAANSAAADTILVRDAANTLAQRNGTTAQTFNLYGTFTDASNYERGALFHTTGTGITLAAQTAGTGADNLDVILTPSGTGSVKTGASLVFTAVTTGPTLKQGANGRVGTFVLNGSTPVTVSNTSIAISDAIIISLNTVGGVVGVPPSIATITAGSGFTVAGTAADTSTYNYAIIKNSA